MKDKKNAAATGLGLLKKKSDAIKLKLQDVLKEILDVKRRVGGGMREAAFSHTQAVWAAGDFNDQVIENTQTATYKVQAEINNVAGIKLPVFRRHEVPGSQGAFACTCECACACAMCVYVSMHKCVPRAHLHSLFPAFRHQTKCLG